MKVAITGGSGFIGKLLIRRFLDAGFKVRILTRRAKENFEQHSDLEFHSGDLSDLKSLANFCDGIDVLYHCAAEIRDESKMLLINAEGTKNLIAEATGKIRHWVQLSSVGVYGPIFSGDVKEDQECHPNNEYERTKLMGDNLVFEAAAKGAFSYTMVRPSNVFGPTMSNKSLFELVKAIDKGYYFYSGKVGASANYVPVENVVEALILAGTNPNAKNQTYIISDWRTIESFTKSIAENLGKSAPRFRIPYSILKILATTTSFIPRNPLTISRVRALNNRVKYSTAKIETELSYKPVISVELAVQNLVGQYQKTKQNV